jgi:hypothetical protein
MSDFVWDSPVKMGTGRGRAQPIYGPRDALAPLLPTKFVEASGE